MYVEAVRLLITLLLTAVGYRLGLDVDGADPARGAVVGAILGAGLGYVLGGVFGRLARRLLRAAPKTLASSLSGPELFAGAIGATLGVVIGAIFGIPLVALLEFPIGWLAAALLVVLVGSVGGAIFSGRATELLSAAGLQRRRPLVARRLDETESALVMDSSAAIDGRVLDLVSTGVLEGRIFVPAFVVDEMQGLADAAERSTRRRGRRGLEMVEALQGLTEVTVLDDEVPEFDEVDAKLIALAERADARLVTTDTNLASAAQVRGIAVVNPAALSDKLQAPVAVGDSMTVQIVKEGTESGQGVGYLDDGTMIVIRDAADRLGEEVDIVITSTTKTRVGRMLFGKPA